MNMARMKIIMCISCFIFSQAAFANECDRWLKHLSQGHEVYVVKKAGVVNSSFQYFEIPGSPYRIAISKEKDYFKNWKVEAKAVSGGSAFVVWNSQFGYSGEFDKDGKCLNSTGFSFNGMNGKDVEPGALDGKDRRFTYSWRACQGAQKILDQMKIEIDGVSNEEIEARIRKSFPKEFTSLQRIAKDAVSAPLFIVTEPSIGSLLNSCVGQSNFLKTKDYPKSLQNIFPNSAR